MMRVFRCARSRRSRASRTSRLAPAAPLSPRCRACARPSRRLRRLRPCAAPSPRARSAFRWNALAHATSDCAGRLGRSKLAHPPACAWRARVPGGRSPPEPAPPNEATSQNHARLFRAALCYESAIPRIPLVLSVFSGLSGPALSGALPDPLRRTACLCRKMERSLDASREPAT